MANLRGLILLIDREGSSFGRLILSLLEKKHPASDKPLTKILNKITRKEEACGNLHQQNRNEDKAS